MTKRHEALGRLARCRPCCRRCGPASAKLPTIYSSLPMHGESRPQSLSIVRAERLALAEHGGLAGGFSADDEWAKISCRVTLNTQC
jgi:hypothetical protein